MLASKEIKYGQIFISCVTVLSILSSIVFIGYKFDWFNKIAIIFAILALPILFKNILLKTNETFSDNINTIGVMLSFIAMLSFVFNGFIYPVQNIYSVVALAINFLVIYYYAAKNDIKNTRNIFLLIFICCLIVSILSLFTLYFKVSIRYGDGITGYYRYLGIDVSDGRFCGLVGNSNDLGRITLCGIISTVFLYKKSLNNITKILLIISNFIFIYTMILSQSRAIIYSFSFGIIVFIFLKIFFKNKGNIKYKGYIKQILIFVCYSFVFLLTFKLINNYSINSIIYHQNNEEVVQENNVSQEESIQQEESKKHIELVDRKFYDQQINDFSSGRFAIWRIGIQGTLEKKPILGFSHGNIRNGILEYIDKNSISWPEYNRHIFQHMHNQFIQFLAEDGIFALFFIVYLYFYIFKLVIKIIFSKRDINEINRIKIPILISVLSCLALFSMVEAMFFICFDNEIINVVLLLVMGIFIKTVKDEYGEEILKDKLLDKISLCLIKLINFIKKPFTKYLVKEG